MAQRVSRRTESLDVFGLAASNESKDVCQFIVENFTHHNIHAVQLIGTFDESNRSLVISRSTLMVHVHKMSLYTITLSKVMNSPSTGSYDCMGRLRVLRFVNGCIFVMLVTACGWPAWSAVRPSRVTFRLGNFRCKSLMLASSRFAFCVRPLAICFGCAP